MSLQSSFTVLSAFALFCIFFIAVQAMNPSGQVRGRQAGRELSKERTTVPIALAQVAEAAKEADLLPGADLERTLKLEFKDDKDLRNSELCVSASCGKILFRRDPSLPWISKPFPADWSCTMKTEKDCYKTFAKFQEIKHTVWPTVIIFHFLFPPPARKAKKDLYGAAEMEFQITSNQDPKNHFLCKVLFKESTWQLPHIQETKSSKSAEAANKSKSSYDPSQQLLKLEFIEYDDIRNSLISFSASKRKVKVISGRGRHWVSSPFPADWSCPPGFFTIIESHYANKYITSEFTVWPVVIEFRFLSFLPSLRNDGKYAAASLKVMSETHANPELRTTYYINSTDRQRHEQKTKSSKLKNDS